MRHICKTVFSDTSIDWKWPVQAGVVNTSRFQPKLLQQNYWAKQLSDFTVAKNINPVQISGGRFNILLFDGVKEAEEALNRFTGNQALQSDIILIKENAAFISNENNADAFARKLVQNFGAGGIFFFSTGLEDQVWFENLMMELSHNQGIPKSLEQLQNTGSLGFVSPNIEKDTMLSSFAENLGKDLVSGKVKLNKSLDFYLSGKDALDYVLHPAPSIVLTDPDQLGHFLINYKDLLDYSGESHTASLLLKIGRESKIQRIPKNTSRAKKPVTQIPVDIIKTETTPTSESAIEPGTQDKPTPPRYLQAGMNKKGSDQSISDFLLPKNDYILKVRIGENDEKWISETTEIDTGDIFKDKKIENADIELELRCNTEKKPLYGKIILPREGSSDIASFPISTGSNQKIFEAEIYAYHKKRLLQMTVYRIDIRNAGDPNILDKAIMKTELVLRKKMEALDERKDFGASMILTENGNTDQPPPGRVGDKPLGFNLNSAMEDQMDKIRSFIEEVVTNESAMKPSLDDEENVDLLRQLASQGSILFELHLNKTDLQGPLQIVTNKREYVPLEFAYSFPAPDADAKLCPNAVQALKDGACKNCFASKAEQHAHICPFGFWGLSHVIERHHYDTANNDPAKSDYIVKNEPAGQRNVLNILNRTQYAESGKVDIGNVGLTQQVDKVIADGSKSHYKASTWKDWKDNVPADKHNPESLILIVHLENDQRVGVDCLEIGNNDLLPVTRFDEEYINAEAKDHNPFVVLIGCETANLKSYAFNASNLLIGRGAAIVLSNFTRIRGKHAGLIVMRLVELLKANASNEIEFGSIVLQLKQQLLAEGIMVSLTLLALGDADWKIKT